MIKPNMIFELNQPFISAASGLLLLNERFYVIGDDENFLGVYDLNNKSGVMFPISNDVLPEEKTLRKKAKKDFEALVYLDESQEVLIVPSGSTAERQIGALMKLDGAVRPVNFQPFYSQLNIQELNIEGAVCLGDELIFLQRGNGRGGPNALIKISCRDFLKGVSVHPTIIPIELGEKNGVKLAFTDAALLEQNILFLAVAEDSHSTYLDGEVKGAVVGLMTASGQLLKIADLDLSSKPEGICLDAQTKNIYLVTDDDDRNKVARLFYFNLSSF